MKILLNDLELFSLTETQKQIMQNNILSEIFEDDIKRRLEWVIMHKYEECCRELKQEWDAKLVANGVKMVPSDIQEYAQLVFSQPNYKNRSQREAENKE